MTIDEKKPCTYILRCADDTLYTGWTNDVDRRIAVHNAGKGGKYTARRTPVRLAYIEYFDSRSEAMKRECAIKKLSRKEKMQLIRHSGDRDT